MGLFTRSTLDSKIDGAADLGQRAVRGASDAVDSASSQLRSLLDDLESSISRTRRTSMRTSCAKNCNRNLKTARSQLNGANSALAGRLNDAAGYADDFVHDKPWHTLGAVAGLALLVGYLAGRA